MIKLVNNQETFVGAGSYSLKYTGVLTVQWDLGDGDGFSTITDGEFQSAGTGELTLSKSCDIKIINAGSNTLTIA